MAAGLALPSFQGWGLQTQNEKSAMDVPNHFWSTAKLAQKGDQILALVRRIFSHQSGVVSGHVLHLHAGFTELILGSNECILNVVRRSDRSLLIENQNGVRSNRFRRGHQEKRNALVKRQASVSLVRYQTFVRAEAAGWLAGWPRAFCSQMPLSATCLVTAVRRPAWHTFAFTRDESTSECIDD